ncbi:MAG: hypothetical protein WD270_06400 [Acetobacterales bacterium]
MRRLSYAALGLLLAGPALAAAAEPGSYAPWESRPVSGLSAQQIDDLRAGRGMALALPAELNGFPGPRHVLDLAGELALTPEQRGRTEAMFAEMQREAAALGDRIVEAEMRLDRLFAGGDPDGEAVRIATGDVARLYGELRFTHLRYHIAMKRLLGPQQLAAYARLRGYDGGGGRHGDHGHGRH